ncbi:MAG: hypothetical protein A2045_05495 [Rhodocyclales bacterium GWA2_65_20]|nr:MAG: hypothetical protein A2045_05495 [Rhodocyclales bacterium GWA2_65_20]
MKKSAISLIVMSLLAACSDLPTLGIGGDYPQTGQLVEAGNINVTPALSIPLEKLFYWGAYAGVAYLILDPLAPNWEIEEARFPEDSYKLSLHMKRYYAGGAGEARVVFHRRAKELVRSGDYGGYEVLEYSEGMESSVLGSQRVAEGVIRLKKS